MAVTTSSSCREDGGGGGEERWIGQPQSGAHSLSCCCRSSVALWVWCKGDETATELELLFWLSCSVPCVVKRRGERRAFMFWLVL